MNRSTPDLPVHHQVPEFTMSNSLLPHGLVASQLLYPWVFSRQEYWSGLPCPPPGALPRSQSRSQTQVSHIAGRFFTVLATRESQEYWSGLPFPSPGDLPDSGIKPSSPVLQSDSLSLSHQRSLSLPPNQTSGMTSIRTFTFNIFKY